MKPIGTTLRADVEGSDAYRRFAAFCSRLDRRNVSGEDLGRLLAADAAIRGLTHTRDLAERRAAATAVVAAALPRLSTVARLDRLLAQLARKVDPRFGSLRVPPRGRDGARRHPTGRAPEHLRDALETITGPRPRWGAVRVTAWLAIRSGALTGPNDPKRRPLEFVMPQIYADELAERRKREENFRRTSARRRKIRSRAESRR
jgi:hypothetical protein